ncbi:MAG: hypothetical protein AAF805_14450, partial [Planctomycetota bacterium]
MALLILRLVFLMVAAGLGAQVASSDLLPRYPTYLPTLVFGLIFMIGIASIALDVVVRRKRLDVV